MNYNRILATAGAVVLAGSVNAQVVIGDFETGLDGWVQNGSDTIEQSSTWSSTGDYSLKISGEGGGFSWAIQYSDLANLSQLNTMGWVMADVYWLTSDWNPSSQWGRWDQAAVNSSETGWSQTDNTLMYDSANPDYPGSWDVNSWGASHQRVLAWNVGAFTVGSNIGDGGWAQLYLAINSDVGPRTFYIDNIRLVSQVPEPTSMVLLGLGGAMLLIRRRMK